MKAACGKLSCLNQWLKIGNEFLQQQVYHSHRHLQILVHFTIRMSYNRKSQIKQASANVTRQASQFELYFVVNYFQLNLNLVGFLNRSMYVDTYLKIK